MTSFPGELEQCVTNGSHFDQNHRLHGHARKCASETYQTRPRTRFHLRSTSVPNKPDHTRFHLRSLVLQDVRGNHFCIECACEIVDGRQNFDAAPTTTIRKSRVIRNLMAIVLHTANGNDRAQLATHILPTVVSVACDPGARQRS